MARSLLASLAALLLASGAQADVPGWRFGGPSVHQYESGVESHGAGKAAYIRSKGPVAESFASLTQGMLAGDYRGKRLRLSAMLKTTEAKSGQMWMRVDGPGKQPAVLAFDNMDNRPIRGTTEWRRYSIVLDVPTDAFAIAFGFFLAGPGKIAADDLRFDTVGPEVPVTGTFKPRNLNFDESRADEPSSPA